MIELPEWDSKIMPKPHAILTLSWEDIWQEIQNQTKREPTRDEVCAVFHIMTQSDMDCEWGTFNSTVEYHVENYLAKEE